MVGSFVGGQGFDSGGTTAASSLLMSLPAGTAVGDDALAAILVNAASANTITPPAGWTEVMPTWGLIGTFLVRLYHRRVQTGDVSWTWTISGTARHLQGGVVAYRGLAEFATWVKGTPKARTDAPTSSTVNTLPGVTVPSAAFSIGFSFERTSATESEPAASGGARDLWVPQVGANLISTLWVGHAAKTAGATGDMAVTYTNAQATNGWGFTLGAPLAVVATPFQVEVANGSGGSTPATVTYYDGTEHAVQDLLVLPWDGYTVTDMDADFVTSDVYWAHRGGSLNWSEESMRAYTNAVWHGCRALEVSVWKTTDDVYAMSHDRTLTATTARTDDIPTSTWAAVAGAVLDTPAADGGVLGRLEDLLDTYGQDYVLILEDKQNTNVPALLDLVEAHVPNAQQHIVWKFALAAADGSYPALVRSRGYKSWGYFYDGDAITALPSRAAAFDYLGLNWNATAPQWAAATGYGKPVVAHVVPTLANATTAKGLGARGIQASNVLAIVPRINVLP